MSIHAYYTTTSARISPHPKNKALAAGNALYEKVTVLQWRKFV